jgi:hypothetical protein
MDCMAGEHAVYVYDRVITVRIELRVIYDPFWRNRLVTYIPNVFSRLI